MYIHTYDATVVSYGIEVTMTVYTTHSLTIQSESAERNETNGHRTATGSWNHGSQCSARQAGTHAFLGTGMYGMYVLWNFSVP